MICEPICSLLGQTISPAVPVVVVPGVIAMSILFITFKLPVYMESQINSKRDERTKPAEAWYWYIGVPVEVCDSL